MPLLPPSRLPRRLKRAVTPLALSYARKQRLKSGNTGLRKSERLSRLSRKWAGTRSVLLAECRKWLIVLVAASAIGLVSALLFSPVFSVKQIQVKRQDSRIDSDEVQKILAPLFSQRLIFITRKNVLSLLTAAYPDITDVAIKKIHPSTLSVSIFVDPIIAELRVMSDGMAMSGSTLQAETDQRYYYVTQKGFTLVSTTRLLQKNPLPTIEVTDWGVRPEDRTLLTDTDTLAAIFSARDMLRENFGITPTGIILYLRAREFHVRTKSFTLFFDRTSPIPVQFERFRELMKSVPLEQVREYVDLRIADRVVYK